MLAQVTAWIDEAGTADEAVARAHAYCDDFRFDETRVVADFDAPNGHNRFGISLRVVEAGD